jgi:hypothetical protein
MFIERCQTLKSQLHNRFYGAHDENADSIYKYRALTELETFSLLNGGRNGKHAFNQSLNFIIARIASTSDPHQTFWRKA